MRTLVTGGHGFIGQYVVERLQAEGRDVTILDPHAEPFPLDGVDHWFGDMRDEVTVTEAMAHCDSWIHLAGVLGTQETIQNPVPAAYTNILGGLNVFQAAAQYEVPGVNIAVGNHWMNNTYSITKTTMERFAQMYNAERGTSINVVRALNAYGPRQVAAAPYGYGKVRKIMPAFVCRALTGEPIEIYGDGNQIMDMIYVADVAWVLVEALKMAEAGDIPHHQEVVADGTEQRVQTIIEAGSCVETTVNDVADAVTAAAARVTGAPAVPHSYSPMRPGEPPSSVVLGHADQMAVTGIEPSDLIQLSEGVRRTVEWFDTAEGETWERP
jgi:nucleoside-diphosphate-sugar epimerase